MWASSAVVKVFSRGGFISSALGFCFTVSLIHHSQLVLKISNPITPLPFGCTALPVVLKIISMRNLDGEFSWQRISLGVFWGFCGGKCVDFTFVSAIPVSGTLHSQRKSSNDKKEKTKE